MTDYLVTAAPPAIAINMDAETAGRRAIAGFLLQILRSIKLGLDMSLSFIPLGEGSQLILHLEPAEGGDAQDARFGEQELAAAAVERDAGRDDELAAALVAQCRGEALDDAPAMQEAVVAGLAVGERALERLEVVGAEEGPADDYQ